MVLGITDLGVLGGAGKAAATNVQSSQLQVSNAFLYLILIQGLFSGLAIGKLAERNFKAGVKHSFILMLVAFIVSSGSNFFLSS